MALELIEIDAPTYWASALVNGDYSALTAEEAARINNWREKALPRDASIVGCKDGSERFTWCYSLYDPGAGCEGGNVCTYQYLTATLG